MASGGNESAINSSENQLSARASRPLNGAEAESDEAGGVRRSFFTLPLGRWSVSSHHCRLSFVFRLLPDYSHGNNLLKCHGSSDPFPLQEMVPSVNHTPDHITVLSTAMEGGTVCSWREEIIPSNSSDVLRHGLPEIVLSIGPRSAPAYSPPRTLELPGTGNLDA